MEKWRKGTGEKAGKEEEAGGGVKRQCQLSGQELELRIRQITRNVHQYILVQFTNFECQSDS